MFKPETEWVPPTHLPDLKEHKEIAIDLETRDPNLLTMGSGSVRGDGEVIGIAIAVEGWSGYFPINHEGGGTWTAHWYWIGSKKFYTQNLQKYFTMQCTMCPGYVLWVTQLTVVLLTH